MTNLSQNPNDIKQAALLKFLFHYLGIGFVLDAADLENEEIIQSLGKGDMVSAIQNASLIRKQANSGQKPLTDSGNAQNDTRPLA